MIQVTKFFCFLILAIDISSFAPMEPKFGLDTFAVYLNEKLIVKQAANEPISSQNLQLAKSGKADKLIIFYSQCNVDNKIGRSRTLTIRDSGGRFLKQWKFADSNNGESKMIIPLVEFQQLENVLTKQELSLIYAADGRMEGQKIMGFQLND